MSTKRPSPLVGYNTAVRYRGVSYHVQTEDSGVDHPHVITHLFAEGGRILATRKTSYAVHVGTPAYPDVVRQLIRAQHKEMLLALRDGAYDRPAPSQAGETDALAAGTARGPAMPASPPAAAATRVAPSPRSRRHSLPESQGLSDSLDEIIIADLIGRFDD